MEITVFPQTKNEHTVRSRGAFAVVGARLQRETAGLV